MWCIAAVLVFYVSAVHGGRYYGYFVEQLYDSDLYGQSRHISPGDVTSLCRRWSKAVFRTMRRRSKDVERLRRIARRHPEWAFRHNKLGFCSVCQEQIASALDVHMINVHPELGHCAGAWWSSALPGRAL